ncbi:hypothetical protein ACRAWB_10040 [Leifsonia poae]|uniref:hypothetical protein n=1 Tax=Leifsonia poae TaxID=110933 RepID=UPI003D694292
MLQNREVAGATLGSGRRRESATFGPYGFLNLLFPSAVLTVFLVVAASGISDPLGMHWSWAGLAAVLSLAALTAAMRGRGEETDARIRAGRHDLGYWTQRLAPWSVLALFAVAFIGHYAGLPLLAVGFGGAAWGAILGVAPVFFAVDRPEPT